MQTKIIWLGNICPTKNRDNPNQGRVYAINGIAPCLNTIGGGQYATNDSRGRKDKELRFLKDGYGDKRWLKK